MLQDLTRLYKGSWSYALACPLLFAVPVMTEAAQHIAEYAQGFYLDIAHAKATEHSGLRIGFGTVKVFALLVARYWVVRWFEWRDAVRTGQVDRRSLATFLPLFAWGMALSLPAIWLPVITPWLTRPLLIVSLFSFLLELLLSNWYRCAPIAEQGGPFRSVRAIVPIFPWALLFTIIALIPPMIVHYTLGFAAMEVRGLLQFVMLCADTTVVGYLGAIICGTPWFVSERARARASAMQASIEPSR